MIICDIDGTLFDNHQRKHLVPDNRSKTENWAEFNAAHTGDAPITHRIQMLSVMAIHHKVVYLTGRTETEFKTTKDQLASFGAPIGYLSMRGVDDHRSSAEVKLDKIDYWLRICRIDDGHFTLIDDDLSVCMEVAEKYPYAKIIKVPSRCCAYLAINPEAENND